MRKPIIGSCFLILMTFSSCYLIPCGADQGIDAVKEEPTNEFLTGTYRLDETTVKFMPGFENANKALLILGSNGILEMKDVPLGTIDFDAYYDSMHINVNAKGEWKSSYNERQAKLQVNFKFENSEKEPINYITSWKIYERDGTPVIYIMVGDPDECVAARFEKVLLR